jgi:glutathione S-transferase
MKLYYMSGACSLASHICLYEAGAKFETAGLDRKSRVFSDGLEIDKVNGKGYVPVLKLDNGQLLTENVAVLLYVSDLYPAAKLAPPAGTTLERYRLIEWLAFINSEVHKGFGPLLHPGASEELKQYGRANLTKRLAWTNNALGSKRFLAAENFSAADAYLFTVLNWTGYAKIDLGQLSNLKRYHSEIAARPSVVSAMKAEGLIK